MIIKDNIHQDSLTQVILKTIAFFDLFNYPLTAFEIYQYLGKKFALVEIMEVLADGAAGFSGRIGSENGFYFLAGREEIVTIRQERYNYARRKIKKAARFVRLFSLAPFVKVIAVANSLGAHNLRDGSDIDFFIITAPRRLWLSRFYCAGLAKLLNSRPRAGQKRDKICLSFYITADYLNLDDLKLPGGDPYFDYWLKDLVLLYNKDKVYENFQAANGLGDKAPGNRETATDRRHFSDDVIVDAPGSVMAESCFSKIVSTPGAPIAKSNPFGDRLEKILKKFQLKIMPSALRAAMNNSDGVIVNDCVLKFYLRDRRREFKEKYGHKINEIMPARD
ncbi:MAG: hypothetical protein WC545_01235 [Patescibacteria group bacterium]